MVDVLQREVTALKKENNELKQENEELMNYDGHGSPGARQFLNSTAAFWECKTNALGYGSAPVPGAHGEQYLAEAMVLNTQGPEQFSLNMHVALGYLFPNEKDREHAEAIGLMPSGSFLHKAQAKAAARARLEKKLRILKLHRLGATFSILHDGTGEGNEKQQVKLWLAAYVPNSGKADSAIFECFELETRVAPDKGMTAELEHELLGEAINFFFADQNGSLLRVRWAVLNTSDAASGASKVSLLLREMLNLPADCPAVCEITCMEHFLSNMWGQGMSAYGDEGGAFQGECNIPI